MSISDSLTAFQAAINNFATVFNNGVKNTKVQEATLADNALELNSLTPAVLTTDMEADLDAHAATDGASHNLTPLQAGTYSQTQVNNQLQNRVAFNGLPISRYGELSYLPVGVSGDFQGATMNFESRWYPGIVEDDGTYVYLRNGTTGTTMGVYYAYALNAISASSMPTPVRTNKRYQPAYFPSGSTARWVTRSDGRCLLGRLQNASGVLGDYFISLTNGTFDATAHVGAIIPAANYPALADQYCSVEAFVGNTNVYLVVTFSPANNTTPCDFQLWSIPIASIQAGGNVTPTKITGWTTQGFGGTFSGTTNIQVANQMLNTSSAALPMVTYPSSPTIGLTLFVDNDGNVNTDSAQDPVSGNIRIRVCGTAFSNVPTSGIAWTQFICFWINVNPTAKTAALEGPATAPGVLTYDSGTGRATYTGALFNTVANNIMAEQYQGGQATQCWASAGYWFSVRDSDPPDYGGNISRAVTSSKWANRYAALAPAATVSGNTTTGFIPSYGTALGGRMLGIWPLPSGYLLAASYGPKTNGAYEWGPVLCQPGASGYSYTSQYNGTLTGFAPAPFRTRISDLGLNIDSYTCLVSEISAAGAVSTSGGYFFEGYNVNGYLSVTVSANTLVGTGSISMTSAALQATKTACWSALGIAAAPVSALQIMIPQNANLPPFAFLIWTDASKNLWAAAFELNYQGSRSGAVTSMTVVSTSGAVQYNTGSVIQGLSDQVIWTNGACTIYEGSDAYFVGFAAKTYIIIPGTGAGFSVRFAIPKSTFRPQWSSLYVGLVGITYNTPFFTGYPGLGFGECDQNPTSSDNYTKIILTVRCTTLAQFTAWAQLSQYVLVSQDVAQGWLVYFTDVTRLIMNGKLYQLQPTTINLTSVQANPANTTFYAYIQIVAGNAQYLITTARQAESPTMMFIGLIMTGASSISSIAMQKVTRIGNYRVSPTKIGSAISASSGTPDVAAHLNWTT